MLKSKIALTCSIVASICLVCCTVFADNLATGRSVELDALNTKTALLLLDGKKLYTLNLESGAASLVADSKSTWFAVDRLSQSVLLATRVENGTALTLYRFDHGVMVPGAKGFVRLVVAELQSMKSKETPTFLLSCCEFAPKHFEKDEMPFWVHFAVGSPAEGLLVKTPVPGLSEISSLLAVGTIGFAGDEKGTFAYAGSASAGSLVAVRDSVQLPPDQPGGDFLFLAVSGGKVKCAWPISFPSAGGGRVIGFTPDGRMLLAKLNIGVGMLGPTDSGFKLIDLMTGKMTPWPMGDPYEVIAADNTLKRALVQMQYAIPPAGAPADAPLQKPDSFDAGDKYRWRAEVIEQGKPPLKVLQVDGGDVELAGTFVDGKFFATDGQTLGAVDEQNRVSSVVIHFGK